MAGSWSALIAEAMRLGEGDPAHEYEIVLTCGIVVMGTVEQWPLSPPSTMIVKCPADDRVHIIQPSDIAMISGRRHDPLPDNPDGLIATPTLLPSATVSH
jgi:hypothetical protein